MMDLPLYRFIVKPEDKTAKLEAVALVDQPAIELNWQAFNANKYTFSADQEKRIISGPLMVAGLPIYRRDASGEYYGVFMAEDIYYLRNKFHKDMLTTSVNEMHDPAKKVDGVYMIESFIVDSARGLHSPTGYKLTDGSWFSSYKVDNDEIWTEFIKTGKFRGFSVEGFFELQHMGDKNQELIEKVIDIIKQIED